MKFPLWLLDAFLRVIEKRHLRAVKDPLTLRPRFERQARMLFVSPPFTTYLPDVLAGDGQPVPALWAFAKGVNRRKVILYLHGGAYVFGSPTTHAAMLARISELTGASCLLPDYRMAPEHPFPAAVEDAETAYRALLARGYRAEDIALGGDSAGGGLTFALLHVICAKNLPKPAAVFGFSPWTDLTLGGETLHSHAKSDAILAAERLKETVDIYLAGADPRDPRASPIFGTFTNAPDVMVQVGSNEILLDDSRRLAEALKEQGVHARLDVWQGTPHVWQIFQSRLKEADKALADLAEFLRAKLG